MNKLLLLGGAPRCGKTTILNEVIQRKPMIGISSDDIRAGVRYLNKTKRVDFTTDMVEDQLPWEMLVGLIKRHDHLDISLIVEGVVLTPGRVKSLNLKNLELRVAFVGFSSDEFIENIIAHGKETKDHILWRIEKNNGDETSVRELLDELRTESIALRNETEKHGYEFFNADDQSFEEYKEKVTDFLLEQ